MDASTVALNMTFLLTVGIGFLIFLDAPKICPIEEPSTDVSARWLGSTHQAAAESALIRLYDDEDSCFSGGRLRIYLGPSRCPTL